MARHDLTHGRIDYPIPNCSCEYAFSPVLPVVGKEDCKALSGDCFYIWWMAWCSVIGMMACKQWIGHIVLRFFIHIEW